MLALPRTSAPVESFDAVVDALDLLARVRAWGDAPARVANLDALRAHVTRYATSCAGEGAPATLTGLFRFLVELPTDAWGSKSGLDQRAVRSEGDAVVVSTWHRSKGLEWPIVVLLDVSEPRHRTALGVSVATDAEELDVADPLADRWVRYWPNPFHMSQRRGPMLDRIAAHAASLEIDEQAQREELRLLYVGWTRARDRLILATRAGDFARGWLRRLEPHIRAPLPTGQVEWAGTSLLIEVEPAQPGAPVPHRPASVQAYERRGPTTYPPAHISPSALEKAGVATETVVLGAPLELRLAAGQELVGSALHAFLAADDGRLTDLERAAMASQLVARWQAGAVSAGALLTASDRLRTWIARTFPKAKHHRELPLAHRTSSGTVVRGTADLLLETSQGWVVIDHKSSGAPEHWGQLQAYEEALRSAGARVHSSWIHLPAEGRLVRITAPTMV